jgi:hypothetical protein
MSTIKSDNEITDEYFDFLKNLNTQSKKELIIALTNSIENDKPNETSLRDIYGAWEDDLTAEELIKDIRDSRTPNRDVNEFE